MENKGKACTGEQKLSCVLVPRGKELTCRGTATLCTFPMCREKSFSLISQGTQLSLEVIEMCLSCLVELFCPCYSNILAVMILCDFARWLWRGLAVKKIERFQKQGPCVESRLLMVKVKTKYFRYF